MTNEERIAALEAAVAELQKKLAVIKQQVARR